MALFDLRHSRWAVVAALAGTLLLCACEEEKKLDIASKINPAKMATMTTKNVSTLISDSGVVQYKIVSPLWTIYDAVDTPYWEFPKGLYLQKYDPYFHVVATVAADSAVYLKNARLWELHGHVELTKAPQDLFQSERLFWDQRQGKIYSDTFIHIETTTHVLEGIGFESDERLSSYRVLKPQGIFPINRENLRGGSAAPGDPQAPQSGPAPSSGPAAAPTAP